MRRSTALGDTAHVDDCLAEADTLSAAGPGVVSEVDQVTAVAVATTSTHARTRPTPAG